MRLLNISQRSRFMLLAVLASFSLLSTAANASEPAKVYELRTYHANEGKLPALQTRFREHTDAIFKRLGMKVVDYWVPLSEPEASNTLIYILEHESEADAKQKWQTFFHDPEWVKAYENSIKDGKLVKGVDVVFMKKIHYSAN